MTSTRRRVFNGGLALALVVLALGGAFPYPLLERAIAAPGESCFTVSDGNDTLYRYNYDGGPFYETIGAVGVPQIEAISWDPVNSILYATDAGQLGTLSQTTGVFSPIGADSGLDMDGLGLDPFTGVMYGAIRRADGQSGGSGVYDDLATIDIGTGAITIVGPISGAVDDSSNALFDIDDLAFDPTTGSLWGVANAGGNDTLVTINKVTGAAIQSIGEFGANDMEGLSWNDIGGLRGTTGAGADLWDIDPLTGTASNSIALSPGADFESLGCYRLAGPLSNSITGTVFLDADVNAAFGPGDTGTAGHAVNLYRDVNGDGLLTNADDVSFDAVLDASDVLASATTNGSGFYTFTVGATGAFIVEVDPGTLPGGSRLTTPGIGSVDFGTAWEITDPDNDFGYSIPAIALTKNTSTPLINTGDSAAYSYQLENTGTEPFPVADVAVTDDTCAPVTGPTSGDTNTNNVLDPGETWTYTCSTSLSQDTTNTAAATVTPVSGPNLVDMDTAVVDVRPTIVVLKTEGVASVPESGATVTFTASVENTSQEEVTLDSISDSDFGDVLDPGNPLVTATTCVGGTVVLPGAGNTYSCTFDAVVSGDASGPAHSNTVTAGASDDEGNTATDDDDATVSFTDVFPTVTVTKTEGVASIAEPGGSVTFTVDVENTSAEPVDLTTLADSDFGNLFAATNTTCSTITIAPAATYTCTFDGVVSGNASGPDHLNTAAATVEDNEGNSVGDNSDATVSFTDVLPTITVTKTADPTTVPAAGAEVTFTIRVDNTGMELVTLASLSDSIYGDVSDVLNPAITGSTCVLPQGIAVSSFHECTFTAIVSGPPGGSELNTVTATAGDDEGNPAIDTDDATVTFADGSIGDFVWLDLDGDGVQDGGAEAGIAGVTVDLYVDVDSSGTVTPGDTLVGTDMTDGSGGYDFVNLLPGDYVVTVTDTSAAIPPSTLTGGVDPTAVTLAAGQDSNDADFGYQPFVTIGDRVWVDTNGDGIQDPGETTGLSGVTVNLVDPGIDTIPGTFDDLIVDSDITDGSGNYLLTGPAGIYVVEFAGLPAGYVVSGPDQGSDDALDSDPNPTSGFTAAVTLPGAGSDLTLDAGVYQPALIGDRVFIDLDTDGSFDPGEGIPSITVSLSDGQTTVTDSDGFYQFAAVAGSYAVAVDGADPDLPAGALLSVGTNPAPAVVVAGETLDTVDFGYIVAGPGISLVKDPASQTILVGSDASFAITVTNIGNVALTGVAMTDPLAPLCDAAIGTLLPAESISYSCDLAGVTADFTNSATAVGTPPIGPDVSSMDTAPVDVVDPAVTITKDPANQTVLSGADATFTITVANTGDVDLASVAVADPLAPGCDASIGALAVAAVVTYTCDAPSVTADFTNTATVTADGPLGALPPVSDTADVVVDEARLAGRVWLDLNGDAVQDSGEPGAGGVTVELLDSGSVVVATISTDGNGDYLFAGLAGDDYVVRVDPSSLPAGTVATADPDGIHDGQTAQAVVLGDNITGLDFGYQSPATFAGLVFVDSNGNAVLDGGELPLPGVTVLVTDSAGALVAIVTDAAGGYSAGVLPGPVTIDVQDPTVPSDHVLTTANDPQDVSAVSGTIVTAPDIGYQPALVDLLLTKVSSEGNVQAGDAAEWILTVTNVGGVDATSTITVTDDLPTGLEYVGAGGSGWNCTEAAAFVTCTHPGPLVSGDALEVRIVTNVDPDLSGTLSNTAQVSMVGDVNVLNNTGVAGIGLLPNTGFELSDVLSWSVLLLALGAGLLLITRRREEPSP